MLCLEILDAAVFVDGVLARSLGQVLEPRPIHQRGNQVMLAHFTQFMYYQVFDLSLLPKG